MSEDSISGLVKEQKKSSQGDEESCPVCLLDDVPLVRTPCRHEVCLPCAERILAAPVQGARDWEVLQIPGEDAHLDVPTRGRCPMCRCEICLFDLKKVVSEHENSPDTQTEEESQLAVQKNYAIASTGLKGRVYVANGKEVGQSSIHFPSGDETNGRTDTDSSLPYVDCSYDLPPRGRLPPKKYFEKGCFFHEATRTFHGKLKWGETCKMRAFGALEWEYALTFSADYQFTTRGALLIKRDICRDPSCQELDCKYPLDGRWTVSWPDDPSRSHTTVVVHGGKCVELSRFGDEKEMWDLWFEENKFPELLCRSDQARFESSCDLTTKDIQVSETIEFTLKSSGDESHRNNRMIWTRETNIPEHQYLMVVKFGFGPGQTYYHALASDGGESGMPKYHSETVWGNTFCQGFTVGLASYHFMENPEQGVYISYEHEETSIWPPLDNGSPIPTKIWFTETSYDTENRIFRGKIDWQGTHGTTWQGSRWWRYEMQFDENFACIMGGYVMSVPLGSDVEIAMSKYGRDLLYANAGLTELCRDGNEEGVNAMEETIETLQGLEQEPLRILVAMMRRTTGRGVRIRYPRSFQR